MLSLGAVPEDSTIYFFFTTAAADGGEESFSATLEEADYVIYKNGTALTLSASTLTTTVIATGVYKLTIDLNNDADFTAGASYWVVLDASDETIDSQAISAVLGHFYIESAAALAARTLYEKMYIGHVLGASGSHSATVVDATGVIGANTPADAVNGELFVFWDSSAVVPYIFEATDFAYPLITMKGLDGITLPVPASGDMLWRAGSLAGLLPTTVGEKTTAAILTKAMTEAYSTDGSTVTLAQALYELLALQSEFEVSGTTMTVKKRDGSTTAMTLTISDATNPTSITRAS